MPGHGEQSLGHFDQSTIGGDEYKNQQWDTSAGLICGCTEAYEDEQAENGKKNEMDDLIGMQTIDPGRWCNAYMRNEGKEGNQASPKKGRYPADQFHHSKMII